jgi:hypothetical protein
VSSARCSSGRLLLRAMAWYTVTMRFSMMLQVNLQKEKLNA